MDLLKKWKKEYINNLDIRNIEWIKLDSKGLKKFLLDNYYDSESHNYVLSDDGFFDVPLGLHYLSYGHCNSNNKHNFILGIINNNINKKTIVSAIIYQDKYYLFTEQKSPLTYISTIEVNSYFRNQGIFTKMTEELINYINPNQDILVSEESELGRKCMVYSKLKNGLINKGFINNIWIDNNDYYTEIDIYKHLTKKRTK